MHHRFLHGIRRAFLAACGGSQSCLPALALLEATAANQGLQEGAANQGLQEGDLLPTASGENRDKEGDLLPQSGGEDDGSLLPQNGEEEDGGLPPIIRGEQVAVNNVLQAHFQGPEEEKTGIAQLKDDSAANNLQSNDGEYTGKFLPQEENAEDQDLQNHDLVLVQEWSWGKHEDQGDFKAGRISIEGKKFLIGYAYEVQFGILQDATYNAAQKDDWALAHVAHSDNGKFATLNAWLMTSPRSRVKMKDDMNQNDAHAWKHDAWVSSSSPSDFSIPIHLADAKVFQTSRWSFLFTSLRGRNVSQSGEKLKPNIPLESAKTKMQTARIKVKTKILLLLIIHATLEPG